MKPEIIIVHGTALQSWLSDLGTFLLFVGLIGIGVYLDSSAMQWVGAIVAFVAVLSRSKTRANRYSIEEAFKRLDEIEARV